MKTNRPRRWWLIWIVALGVGYVLSHRWGFRTLYLLPLVWLGTITIGFRFRRANWGRWQFLARSGMTVLVCGAIGCSYLLSDRFLFQAHHAGKLLARQTEWIAAQPSRQWRVIRRQFDPAARPAWTSSRFEGTPDPLMPYTSQLAFPRLHFKNPIALTWNASVERWFLAEEHGRLFSFADTRTTDQALELLQLAHDTWGLAVHPRFADNGYLYVSYHDQATGSVKVSRFQADRQSGLADRSTETLIIEWPLLGHAGGCLAFGPDGMLYVSVGDGGPYDASETGQDISDLLGSILRLNVDVPAATTAYSVPADNPFVGREGARPEIWSYGLRQVWKMAFDPATGELWAGDVGQDLWESIHLIRRGGNCGWSINEGSHPLYPERKVGPTPIIPPVVDQSHAVMRSITGGEVYHGETLPKLRGRYLYGEYDTGTVWSIERDGEQTVVNSLLADTSQRISGFAVDRRGEVLILDHVGGQIFKLAENVPTARELAAIDHFPRKLSETGLFASTAEYQPAAGLLPYSVNSQLWSDGAYKDRFLAVKGNAVLDFEAVPMEEKQPGWNTWRFPDGTALVKTFWLELETGNSNSRRRVETRVMVVEDLPEDPDHYYKDVNKNWRMYTYAWNEDQTDAELVDRDGLDRPYQITDPETGDSRQQIWHYPSRFECLLCHTKFAGFVLGVKTGQMNRTGSLGHPQENQLAYLDRSRLLDLNAPQAPLFLPAMADPTDDNAPLELRARAYLHANCSHCHMPYGGGNSKIDLRYHIPLAEMNLLAERPTQGNLKIDGVQLVMPGDPERSLLYQRMNRLGTGRMPKVGSTVVDVAGARLIHDWILQLGGQSMKAERTVDSGRQAVGKRGLVSNASVPRPSHEISN